MSKEYNATVTNSKSCYRQSRNYGTCTRKIVPPKPATTVPQLFRYIKPHAMPEQKFTSVSHTCSGYMKINITDNDPTYNGCGCTF